MKRILYAALICASLAVLPVSCSIIDINEMKEKAGLGDYADPRLNGTWISPVNQEKMVMSDGYFEAYYYNGAYYPTTKGAYFTNGSKYTRMVTGINGVYLYWELQNIGVTIPMPDNKWYGRNDLRKFFIDLGFSAGNVNDMLNGIFVTEPGTYSLSGNTVTFTLDRKSGPGIFTFNRE